MKSVGTTLMQGKRHKAETKPSMQAITDKSRWFFSATAMLLGAASTALYFRSTSDPSEPPIARPTITSAPMEASRTQPDSPDNSVPAPTDVPYRQPQSAVKQLASGQPRELSVGKETEAAFSVGENTKPSGRSSQNSNQPSPINLVRHLAPPDDRSPGATRGEFVFNFQEAPWDLVLKRFAEEAGLALQMNTVPPGTFTHIDQNSYTPTEALDILNGSLLQNGFLLLRDDHFLIVYPTSGEIPVHLIPQVAVEALATRGKNELIRTVLPLDNVNAVAASQEIQPILSPFGSAVPLPQSNHLVVTDLADNVAQVYSVLQLGEGEFPLRPSIVVHLKNTPAEEVAKAVNEFLASRPTEELPQGDALESDRIEPPSDIAVVPESHTNSLIVSAPPRYMGMLERLIAELDAAPAQVVIQVLLVEVELDNTDEFGVELGVQDSVLFDRSVIDNIVTVTETVTNGLVQTTNQRIISQEGAPGFAFNNAPLGNNTAIRPSVVGGQGLSNFAVGRTNSDLGYGGLVLAAGSDSVSLLLRALAARRTVDILSRPQIRTIHNRPAQIQIGQQVPVVDGVSVTAVGSANPIIRQEKAGIILDVTPKINLDGTVVIDVNAEKSAFQIGPGSGVPIFTDATNGNVIEAPVKDVTSAVATVSVCDGQTIVLGGMIIKTSVNVKRKVPKLGDIPYIGRLFRYDLEKTNRRELLIFLTPKVIFNSEDSDAFSAIETERICLPHADVSEIHGPLFPEYLGSPTDASSTITEEYEELPPGSDDNNREMPADQEVQATDNEVIHDMPAPALNGPGRESIAPPDRVLPLHEGVHPRVTQRENQRQRRNLYRRPVFGYETLPNGAEPPRRLPPEVETGEPEQP